MKEYTINIGGLEHTVQLSDEDAKARGLTGGAKTSTAEPIDEPSAPAEKEAPAPANKARTAPSK